VICYEVVGKLSEEITDKPKL